MALTRRQWLLAAATPAFGVASYWPKTDWEKISPKDASAKPDAIEDALTYAGDRASTGVVILRHGRILAERYWRDWTPTTAQPIFSASKSVTATLIGMAIDARKIRGIQQSAADFIPAWKSTPKAEITLRHLLTMTSGLSGVANQNKANESQFDFMANAEQTFPPGEKWLYHTPAYRMLLTILHRATGEDPNTYSQRALWGPLGMTNSQWDSLPSGKSGEPNWLWMRASLRDMSRFGLFALRQGKWENRQLVSASYMKEAVTPSQKLNESYGYLWWVNSGNSFLRPGANATRREGHLMPGVPADAYAALGAMDKKIYVVPSLDLVVSRHGSTAGKESDGAMSSFDNEFLGRICRAIA